MPVKRCFICLGFITILVFLFSGCGSKKIPPDVSPEERMDIAIEMFEDGKYYGAKNQFRVITLSHGGTRLADKAQFYLAECHFNLKEYILAASEYERLLKIFPSSEYVDDAKYKLGMSYYELSPKFSRDQEYTNKAIIHFQEFLEEYHDSPLVPKVEKLFNEARNKLAKKIFTAANQYRKMGENRAAIIYFDMVLQKYYDTALAARAQYWKGECLQNLKEYEKANQEFNNFISKNPEHELVPKAREHLMSIKEKIKDQHLQEDEKKKEAS